MKAKNINYTQRAIISHSPRLNIYFVLGDTYLVFLFHVLGDG